MQKITRIVFIFLSLIMIQGFTSEGDIKDHDTNSYLEKAESDQELDEEEITAIESIAVAAAKDKYLKRVTCICSVSASLSSGLLNLGDAYRCKNKGFEKCTSAYQESECECRS